MCLVWDLRVKREVEKRERVQCRATRVGKCQDTTDDMRRGSWASLVWQRGDQGGSDSSPQPPEGQSEPSPSHQCQAVEQGSTAQAAVVPGPWEVHMGDLGPLALEGGAALGQVTEWWGSPSLGASKPWQDKARAALIQCCRQSYSRAPFHQNSLTLGFLWAVISWLWP